MKIVIPGLVFGLQLLLALANWLVAGYGFLTGVCYQPAPAIVAIVWAAGFIFGLLGPGLVLRYVHPKRGLLLLAFTWLQTMLWVSYGDFVLGAACH